MSTDIYQPYMYVIRDNKTGELYGGSRFAKGCHPSEFMKPDGYLTSSEVIRSRIEEDGIERFSVVKLIPTMKAYELETRFLQRYNIAANKNWLNGHNNQLMTFGTKPYETTMLKLYGVTHNSKIPERMLAKAKKGGKTRKETYLDNGLTIAQDNANRCAKTKHETLLDNGKTLMQNTIEKSAKTSMETYLDNGLTIAQDTARKAAHTVKTTICDNGLTLSQNRAKKGWNNIERKEKSKDAFDSLHEKIKTGEMKHPRSVSVTVNGVTYASKKQASDILGYDLGKLHRLLPKGVTEIWINDLATI